MKCSIHSPVHPNCGSDCEGRLGPGQRTQPRAPTPKAHKRAHEVAHVADHAKIVVPENACDTCQVHLEHAAQKRGKAFAIGDASPRPDGKCPVCTVPVRRPKRPEKSEEV